MSLFQISRPEPGQTLVIHAVASDKITLGFPIEGVTLSRDDNALIFSFNDGAVIRLDDFYVDYRADFIPEFEVDGRLMSGTNFFTTFGPDLMPEAVPEHETRNAHVIQAYGDSSLMGGLDHLNGLDASAQEKSSAADGGIQFDSALAVGHGPADHGSGAPEPELPPLPVWPFMRVVFYYPGDPGDADAKISIPMYYKYYYGGAQSINPEEQYYTTSGEHGNMYAFTVSMPEGWSASWVDFNIGTGYGDTQISLTPEGAAELRRLGLTGKNLEGRIHVKVTNQVSGDTFEYDVQLVTTTSQNFDSVEYDRQSVGHHLENVGELHRGQNNSGVYSIISSSQNDRIDLYDEVRGGSSIYASGSADRAHMANDRNSIIVDGINNSTPGTITHITSADGTLGTGYIYAYESGTENVIDMGKGRIETYLSGAMPTGTFKAWGGKNIISGGDVDIRAFVTALDTIGGTNDITSSGGVTVDVTNDIYADIDGPHASAAIKATGQHGNNSIKTDSGYVTVVDTLSGGNFSHNYGIHSAYNGSNSITTKSGHVIVDIDMNTVGNNFGRGYGIGVHSVDNSNNNITTDSGDVTVTGNSNGIDNQGVGSGMTATIDDPRSGQVTSPDSGNTITTNSGSVAFTGTCTGTGSAYGIQVDGSGTNRIITKSGEVTVTGEDAGNSAKGYGMSAYGRSNCSNMITTDSGSVTVIGKGSVIGAGIDCGGYYKCTNIITTGSGAVTVSGTSTTDGRGMNVAEGYNTITTNSGEVKVSGSGADSGRGMSAESQGVNTIESTAGSPLTVTITASADTAEKAIAMWAKGEHVGGVNSITGHSQAGGTGDSVTLTANDGQGIAMLTGYLGKNIITTGAGDDSVTINGAVTSLDPKPGSGPGNEIDLGGGNNTLTLNGAVEAGGLKVSSEGGTYTLVLQAPDAESFVARYGDWITAIGADPLIAGGLRGISFVGLNPADLTADFMTTFEGVLEAIYTRAGADAIVPSELIDLLPGHDS
ncbi:MAG: hypothetical protein RBR41_11670, partial [Desulfovibrio sp.]|nr:hypothetical protein [Desulfovibrio sp.]